MKKAIFLYDLTGIMAQPWLDAGYECWCFDGQHPSGITRDGNHVKVGMMLEANAKLFFASRIVDMVGHGVEFVFGFPECTHLAGSGAKHFANKLAFNPFIQLEAVELADLVRCVGVLCGCPWGFENPRGRMSTLYRNMISGSIHATMVAIYSKMICTRFTLMSTLPRMPTTRTH